MKRISTVNKLCCNLGANYDRIRKFKGNMQFLGAGCQKLINIRKDSQYRDELLHILTAFNDARERMYELLSEVDSEK